MENFLSRKNNIIYLFDENIAQQEIVTSDFATNSTYFFYYTGIFLLILLFYRKYLSLPVKK